MTSLFNRIIRNELLACFKLAVAIFILIALISYHIDDSAYTTSSFQAYYIHNVEGLWGAYLSDMLFYYVGYAAFSIPIFLLMSAYEVFYDKPIVERLKFGSILLVSCITLASMCSIYIPAQLNIPQGSGGLLGQTVAWYLLLHTGISGAIIILCFLLLATLQLISEFSWKKIFVNFNFIKCFDFKFPTMNKTPKPEVVDEVYSFLSQQEPQESINKQLITSYGNQSEMEITELPDRKIPKRSVRKRIARKIDTVSTIELLNSVKDDANKVDQKTLRMLSKSVEEKLLDFGLNVTVASVIPGPVITRFEIKLAAGTKVSKISSLAKDLARSLSVKSVRVVEVIAGKSVIGLELPNPNRQMVSIKSVLESDEYIKTKLNLPMALGKNISGEPMVVDLARMPHLLVAGTTGAGKSVGLNVILISLLMKMNPKDLRLILIDPKMLELSIYEKIPHLLTPVVTDMNDASTALRWCVAEMERRYQLMSEMGVRSIQGYNDKLASQSSNYDEHHKHLPYIVVIADEFADMIMVVGKKVEQLIARLAQKARAAGIHLILATQRPSVDVITGLIKANVPSRIAFAVSSKIDSRTILDQQGAEQLLGYGDMLYLPPGSGLPTRVHGAFVSDEEVHRIVESIKQQNDLECGDDIMNQVDSGSSLSEDGGVISATNSDDELYDKAVDIVIKTRKASISNIQRRLRIGYNRAATLVEAMEVAGVVSSMENNGTRQVLAPEREGE
ncbi:MAG TPA: DNA translocase FtsK 4TM domain-containing protein [Gammaproteobacteria bacterium]|nr:DNA translocase FtsK 4TM domain-containing protein [Gammaproteobacteria bacterium]